MSKEIRSVLGTGLRCYLPGADVLEVMSLSSYSGHNSTTGCGRRCQSEILSALRVLSLGHDSIHMCISMYLDLFSY